MNNMDRLVAEKVMGWKLHSAFTDPKAIYLTWVDAAGNLINKWNPSACTDDALKALQHIAGKRSWGLERIGDFDDEFLEFECCIWIADENDFLGYRAEFMGRHASAAMAISLCALDAAAVPASMGEEQK